jgi:L-ribulose-5-phosphate 3-epimerase UlaE
MAPWNQARRQGVLSHIEAVDTVLPSVCFPVTHNRMPLNGLDFSISAKCSLRNEVSTMSHPTSINFL